MGIFFFLTNSLHTRLYEDIFCFLANSLHRLLVYEDIICIYQKVSIDYNEDISFFQQIVYIEDLTLVLMFYQIYKTSWGKAIKYKAWRAFYGLFAMS